MRRAFMVLSLLLLLGLAFASRYYPTVRYIQVSGNKHYSASDIAALTGIRVGSPLLWITKQHLNTLANDPWIQSVQIVRAFPNALHIQLSERVPILYDTVQTYAADGTVLPNVDAAARQSLIKLQGWGKLRIDEALDIVALVNADSPHAHQLEVISYSAAGFTLQFATPPGQNTKEIFTPSVDALKTQWASVMALSETSKTIALYPWGVTAHE
ncbi:MAG: cell division protein FtsQ/DivIB [Trueperaceae bacterium]